MIDQMFELWPNPIIGLASCGGQFCCCKKLWGDMHSVLLAAVLAVLMLGLKRKMKH